jgi:hypothetical protein
LEHDIVAVSRAIDACPARYRVRYVVVGRYAYRTLGHHNVNAGLCDSALVFVETSSPVVGSSANHRGCNQSIADDLREDHVVLITDTFDVGGRRDWLQVNSRVLFFAPGPQIYTLNF